MPKPMTPLLWALVCTLTILLASTVTVQAEPYRIHGQVLDPSGTPVSGATVTLTPEDQ